jgi:hypothetical protein
MLKRMLLIQGLALLTQIAPTAAQSPSTQTMQSYLDHAEYFNTKGERAETECYLRLAQRLQPANPFLKQLYQAWSLDSPRDLVLRLAVLWGGGHKAGRPRELIDTVNPVIGAVGDKKLPKAIESATRAANAFKAAGGEIDADYLMVLETVADLHALNGNYRVATSVLVQIFQIRKQAYRLAVTKPRELSEYQAEWALQSIMSKLADAYWNIGKDAAAAALRDDAMTKEGDAVRLRLAESNDAIGKMLRGPTATHRDHPSCMAGLR